MKKFAALSIMIFAVLAFVAAPAFACGADKDATATTASAKSADGSNSCSASKANATTASAKECHGMSKEECAKICAEFDGKCEIRSISVQGMTCGGCETGVKTALEGVDGVLKVVKVSHTDKFALVVVDPAKVKVEALTTAVTNKGFKAQMASFNSTTAPTADGAKKSCAKICAEKKAAADKTEGSL